MILRPARKGDVDALIALWEALQRDGRQADARYRTYPDARTAMLPLIRDLWLATDPFPGCFVAEAPDGALVGFVAGTLPGQNGVLAPRSSLVITDMYVAPEARRQGLGRRLVDALVAAAKPDIGVEVGTLYRDERAVAFWTALGFAPMYVRLVRPE